MAGIISNVAFEPLLTGPLLFALTRGSEELRGRIFGAINKLPVKIEHETVIKTLKWLFALGLVGRVNNALSAFASNNWTFGDSGGRPWHWPSEIAAITGGSGGLGSVVIQRIAQTGMKIAIMDVQPPGPELARLPNVHFYECDITNPESVDKVAAAIKKDLGAPTILFNNAGIGKTFPITEMPPAFLNKIFQINLLSHWYTVKAFLPDMIKGRKGHIIATASMASFIQVSGMVDYCVTKAGVMSFHEGLTQEIRHRYKAPFIRTSVVHPYWVRTNLTASWNQKQLEGRQNNNPLLPLMTPDYVGGEISKVILSGKSQRVMIPPQLWSAPMIRGMPHWLQEVIRDYTKNMTPH